MLALNTVPNLHTELDQSSVDMAQRFAPDNISDQPTTRAITADQTNQSIVIDEAVVVKWLRPPLPVTKFQDVVLRHLRHVGFVDMPTFYGTSVVDGLVTAIVTEFIPDAVDGWDWCVAELTTELDAGSIEGALRSAGQMGTLTGRLHQSLAQSSEWLVAPTGSSGLDREFDRGIALLTEASDVTVGQPGQRLRARSGSIRSALDALIHAPALPTQLIHSDLHVGQFLRSPTRLAVNDFDGNPVNPDTSRRSPMIDLAGLLQSIDHVARVVTNRRPDLQNQATNYIDRAQRSALLAYSAERPCTADELEILWSLRVLQELHEFVYAARSLPRWLYVPDASLTGLFPMDDS